jgi:hypothetical protein
VAKARTGGLQSKRVGVDRKMPEHLGHNRGDFTRMDSEDVSRETSLRSVCGEIFPPAPGNISPLRNTPHLTPVIQSFHHVSKDYLPLYLNEFTIRHNFPA